MGLGACPPPRKFLEFRGYEVASETIFGPKQCFSEATRQSFTCMNIYPFCPLCHIALVSAFRSFANHTSHTLRRSFGWKNGKFLPRSFILFAAISYYVATNVTTLCARHAWAFAEHWPYLATPSKPWVRGKVVRLKPD